MNQTLFRPEATQFPDTLVISYYPLGGNDTNTGPRYQREADITQFNILGITREGSDTTTFDRALRNKLKPTNFDEAWQQYTAGLNEQAKEYDYVIARGQSTGSFPTLNIVNNGQLKATHLEVEDGINTRATKHGKQKNAVSAKFDWLVGLINEKVHKPDPLEPSWQKVYADIVDNNTDNNNYIDKILGMYDGIKGVGKFAVEVAHWAPLWQSDYSRNTTLEIAYNRPDLPILCKFLGHTATNKPQEAIRFIEDLSQINQKRQSSPEPTAEVRGEYDASAWHCTLEYPEYGARNLLAARAMKSFVTKK